MTERLLCELQGGGAVVVKPDGDIHITLKTNIGYDATCVIDPSLLDILAREWMDRRGIKYHTAVIKGADE
jgi:hypothetical protein